MSTGFIARYKKNSKCNSIDVTVNGEEDYVYVFPNFEEAEGFYYNHILLGE